MNKFIIGIAGNKNAGKDTFASMLNYIFSKGLTNATYREWITQRKRYELTFKDIILHFGDNLKDCLSIMYQINRECFDDRTYKDELWYNITNHEFISEKDSYEYNMVKYTIEDFEQHSLSDLVDNPEFQTLIKLRTLMQYYGTELCRNTLSRNIWVNNTIRKAEFISDARNRCFVADVRFNEEADAIMNAKSSTGVLIRINRPIATGTAHESETINFDTNYVIENDNTLLQLFYKAVQIVQILKGI